MAAARQVLPGHEPHHHAVIGGGDRSRRRALESEPATTCEPAPASSSHNEQSKAEA